MASNFVPNKATTPTSTTDFLSSLQFESLLGSGAFGLVIKATDHKRESQFAVKFLFVQIEEKHIQRECKIKELPPHENIIQVIDAIERTFTSSEINEILPEALFQNDEEKFTIDYYFSRLNHLKKLPGALIKMELCGETLREWLAKKHDLWDPSVHEQQYAIVKNLIAGLAHLHANKILHRDLKPENVMFSKIGFILPVKIGDFGLSRCIHSEKSRTNPLTSRIGTFDYMAPECRQNEYGFPADIYSLGLIIWEVAQLIASKERSGMFDELVNDKEDSLIKLHPQIEGLRDLIVALTKKKVAERFQRLDQVQMLFVRKEFSDLKKGPLLTARNEKELHKCLKEATPGSTIFLIETVYKGNFIMRGKSVTIVGRGDKTILQNSGSSHTFVVTGTGNKILNLKISQTERLYEVNCLRVMGDKNSCSDLTLAGGEYSVKIEGSENKFDNIHVFALDGGIYVTGSHNILNDIKLTGNKTSILFLFLQHYCILSEGTYNKFCRIAVHGEFQYGILFTSTANFNCLEYCANHSETALWLRIQSNNLTASNIKCNRIDISGNNVRLTEVDKCEMININSTCVGVELHKCRAKELRARTNVLQINSKFDSWTKL